MARQRDDEEKRCQITRFLRELGARQHRSRKTQYILDEIDWEFYLRFDTDLNEDDPKSRHTCDILVVPLIEEEHAVRVVANCREHQVMRFLFALGIDRFSDKTKQALYSHDHVIKTL